MKRIMKVLGALIALTVFASCQSAKSEKSEREDFESWPISPGQSLIQTEVLGFSPLSESGNDSIDFDLFFSNPNYVHNWTVTVSSNGVTKRTFSGNDTYMPSVINWDGKNSSGKFVSEGIHKATLTVNYRKPYTQAIAESTEFILSLSKPSGIIKLTPSYFSLETENNPIKIEIDEKPGLGRIESWTMNVYDPGWNLFRTYSGKWPSNSVFWDGMDFNGSLVASAEDYPVVVYIRDEFGTLGLIETSIPTDIIIIEDESGNRIVNSRIYFKGFTANHTDVSDTLLKQNNVRLDRLAEILTKYPDHKIKIVGHAVMIHWENPGLGLIEQEKVLIPLSLARAEAIKRAIVQRGVNPAIITTEGAGASNPLVPDNDYSNRWINRRTSIYLMK